MTDLTNSEARWMRDMHNRLIEITRGCTNEMHEPDNQGVSAKVYGDHLDNAMGDEPEILKLSDGKMLPHVEYCVAIEREGGETEWFNLSSLIALARQARID